MVALLSCDSPATRKEHFQNLQRKFTRKQGILNSFFFFLDGERVKRDGVGSGGRGHARPTPLSSQCWRKEQRPIRGAVSQF